MGMSLSVRVCFFPTSTSTLRASALLTYQMSRDMLTGDVY